MPYLLNVLFFPSCSVLKTSHQYSWFPDAQGNNTAFLCQYHKSFSSCLFHSSLNENVQLPSASWDLQPSLITLAHVLLLCIKDHFFFLHIFFLLYISSLLFSDLTNLCLNTANTEVGHLYVWVTRY